MQELSNVDTVQHPLLETASKNLTLSEWMATPDSVTSASYDPVSSSRRSHHSTSGTAGSSGSGAATSAAVAAGVAVAAAEAGSRSMEESVTDGSSGRRGPRGTMFGSMNAGGGGAGRGRAVFKARQATCENEPG